MNKKLISLAVAAAMAAPAAAMAEATLYGKLHVSIDYMDIHNAIAPNYNFTTGEKVYGGENFEGWGINGSSMVKNYMTNDYGNAQPIAQGRANRFGLKGSEDLGNGMKAIYQIEFGINLSDNNNNVTSGNDGITMRNSFVGLAGGWGTALVGRHDTPMKISTGKLDLFSDTMADYNGTIGFHDVRADNAVAYISPSFAGFSVAAAMVAPGSGTAGAGSNINLDSLAEAYSLAAIYNNGPFYASAAYESLGNEHFMNTATSDASGTCASTTLYDSIADWKDASGLENCKQVGNDWSKWRIGLGLLDWNGFTLTAIYEQQDDLPAGQQTFYNDTGYNIPAGSKEAELWQVQAAYAFGNSQIKAMYGQMDRDGSYTAPAGGLSTTQAGQLDDYLSGDRESWAIGLDHNFSKRTKAYVLYTDVTDDRADLDDGFGITGAEWSGFSLGMIHSF
ncbi:porin [Thiohalocapsa marina]|uniref:Porin n=1 Tax=Thiohalocapsa marina TaxID=424902 RepID=A0A5M8FU24_9GAMM|nr:porin [Thiohalocapsa marina]KAA6187321.1 porin [Thiohalocapsa marina]